MLFVLGLIVLASLFAGALPAMHAARVSAGAALKDDSRSSTSARLGKFSSALVVAELAVSCGLLIAAGLMIKSVVQLKNVQMPFAIEQRAHRARRSSALPTIPDSRGEHPFLRSSCCRSCRRFPASRRRRCPTACRRPGNGVIPVQIEGKAYPQDSDYPLAREGIVTAGYFETFQTPRAERPRVHDRRTWRPASRWPSSTSRSRGRISRTWIRSAGRCGAIAASPKEPWLTIVGVVPDLLMEGIGNNNASPVGYYIPIAQSDVGQRRSHGRADAWRAGGDDVARARRRRVARSRSRDLRDQHDAPGHRSTDVVLHDLRHVLHGVRHLRAVSRGGGSLRRDVVCRDAADAGDGRAFGARGAGPAN